MVKVYTTNILFSVLFLLCSVSLSARDCDCEVTYTDGVASYSAECSQPTEICTLTIGDDTPAVDLQRFSDLRGVHVYLGKNVYASFLGSALADSKTKFITKDGASITIIDDQFGLDLELENTSANRENSIQGYNNDLNACDGTCTLLAPTLPFVAAAAVTSLPVSLLDWTAEAAGRGVTLSWETAAETDNDYFALLRSTDGVTFTTVATVAGRGTTDRVSSYRFVDTEAAAGTNYYRLEQVDYDGTRSDLGLREVRVTAPAAAATLSPNPAAPGVSVRVARTEAAGTPVRVLDLAGRPVAEDVLDGSGRFRLPTTLQAGMYVVVVRDQATRLLVRP